jgi:short-subunit dehydrogenase
MEGTPLFASAKPATAQSVARAGWKAMKAGRRIRVTGLRNRLNVFAMRFLPRATLARIAAKAMKKP